MKPKSDIDVPATNATPARAGWAEASKAIAKAGDDKPTWPEVANDEDKAITWQSE